MTDDRLNAEAAERLGEIARRAGVESRGGPRLQEELNISFPQALSSP